MMPLDSTLNTLRSVFGDLSLSEFRGQTRVVVPAGAIHEVLELLKNRCGFDLLVDITCVDYLHYPAGQGDSPIFAASTSNSREQALSAAKIGTVPGGRDRFGLVYLLANTATNERITIRAMLNDPEPAVHSAVDLWEGANWLEREVWDMFGIRFEGHPDLRRILLPEQFTAFPLRKDYPLQGRGERHGFPVLTRVEPESLNPDALNPDA